MYNTDELLERTEVNGKELEYLLSQRNIGRAKFLLIDVREEYEYNQKRIVGVDYLIPLSDFFNKTHQIEDYKSMHIIATCKLGGRSAQAQMQLKRMGFKRVINLAGGIANFRGDIKQK